MPTVGLLLVGLPPGVGKTHLAISLPIRAAQSGRRVYYGRWLLSSPRSRKRMRRVDYGRA
jgi:Mrp family chromosome partitioning ATPase